MVTADALDPFEVVVKNVVPVELDDNETVAAAFELATGLPKLSWACTWKGPTFAEDVTVWLPVTGEVKTSLVGVDATTLNCLELADVTPVCVASVAVTL